MLKLADADDAAGVAAVKGGRVRLNVRSSPPVPKPASGPTVWREFKARALFAALPPEVLVGCLAATVVIEAASETPGWRMMLGWDGAW